MMTDEARELRSSTAGWGLSEDDEEFMVSFN
jgi:hypothetical protein